VLEQLVPELAAEHETALQSRAAFLDALAAFEAGLLRARHRHEADQATREIDEHKGFLSEASGVG
jgi:hypothetical protein